MTKKTTAARETLDAAKGKAVKKQQTADALGAAAVTASAGLDAVLEDDEESAPTSATQSVWASLQT